VALQAGVFSREANAAAMAERLNAAGFESAVSRRAHEGGVLWVVTVPPGPDADSTVTRLKDSGFESFPLF
jgi:cell division septation protein DedD